VTTTTTPPSVPWRHRRGSREADRNRKKLDDATFQALVTETQLAQPAAPTVERVPIKDRPRLPVARPVMKSPKDEIRWVAGHVGNRVGHHALRVDQHAWTFACASCRGLKRTVGDAHRYLRMPHHLETLTKLITEGEREKHDRLAERLKDYRKNRRAAAGGVACGALVALLVLLAILGPRLTVAVLAVGIPAALAVVGRRRGPKRQPVMQIDTRPIPKADPRPSPELIYQAFHESGIKGIVVETAPHRVGGGWETIVRIPIGTQTFDDAVKNHVAIAGNLETTSDCTFLTPLRGPGGSTKHVRLWYTKADPFLGDPPPHPLLDPKNVPADLWDSGLPIGLDQRGTIARLAITDTPFVLVVGQPGSGKTFLLFGIGAAIAADPLWDLDCWTFKDSGSFAPLEPLVKACGGTYDYGSDPKTIDRFYKYLIRIRNDLRERNQILDRMPIAENLKDKVERAMATAIGSRLRPRLVFLDEFITPIKADSRILPLMDEIARLARSQHIVFVCSAQRGGKKTLEELQSLFGGRVCFSVDQHDDAEGALSGYYQSGLTEAHRIPLSAKGVAYVGGALVDPEIGPRPAYKIRTFGIDRQILADHVARQLAGPRSGQGPRVQLAKAEDPFVANLTAALGDGPAGVATLAKALGYGEGTGATRDFTKAARAAGIEPRTETRDAGGVVARGAKYIDPEQLDGR
jgi:hypothetical protein